MVTIINQLTALQSSLISVPPPLMLLILIIDFTKASKNSSLEAANLWTSGRVMELVRRAWSEDKRLLPCTSNLKYALSNCVGVESKNAPAFFTLLFKGHTCVRVAANDRSIVGSTSIVLLKLRILFSKDEQWENPSVCPPTIFAKSVRKFRIVKKI